MVSTLHNHFEVWTVAPNSPANIYANKHNRLSKVALTLLPERYSNRPIDLRIVSVLVRPVNLASHRKYTNSEMAATNPLGDLEGLVNFLNANRDSCTTEEFKALLSTHVPTAQNVMQGQAAYTGGTTEATCQRGQDIG